MQDKQNPKRHEQTSLQEVVVTRDRVMSMLGLFGRAQRDYAAVFDRCVANGWRRVVLAGSGDLAEIAAICAARAEVAVAAVIDPVAGQSCAGRPVVRDLAEALAVAGDPMPDAIVITDPRTPQESFEAMMIAVSRAGIPTDRIVAPPLLRLKRPTKLWSWLKGLSTGRAPRNRQ